MATVDTTFNVFSYDEVLAEHRIHRLPDAEQMRYVIGHKQLIHNLAVLKHCYDRGNTKNDKQTSFIPLHYKLVPNSIQTFMCLQYLTFLKDYLYLFRLSSQYF